MKNDTDKLMNDLYKQHKKTFGVFVGLFNRLTGSKFSVEHAFRNDYLRNKYFNTMLDIRQDVIQKPEIILAVSTRNESLQTVDVGDSTRKVLNALQSKNYTRAEVSEATGLRLSSVCGRVNELIQEGLVVVKGYKTDHKTNKKVEIVGLI
jgi:hypothetical protein